MHKMYVDKILELFWSEVGAVLWVGIFLESVLRYQVGFFCWDVVEQQQQISRQMHEVDYMKGTVEVFNVQ